MKAAGVAELRAEGRIGVHKAGTAKATAAADLWLKDKSERMKHALQNGLAR